MTGFGGAKKSKLPELIAGICGLALAILIAFASFQLPEFPVQFAGPGFYPRVLAGILAAISVALLFSSLRGAALSAKSSSPEEAGRGVLVMLAITASVVYYLTLPLVGFVLTTIVYFAFLMFMMQPKEKVWKIAFWSVGSTVVIYVAFAMMLKATLPIGNIFR